MKCVLTFVLLATGASGADLQHAELRNLRLTTGETISSCMIGYRTFGRLDDARSNAVLFPTWFSGNSADLESLIGPGKLVDPARYYVVAVDALGNGVSCAPSTGLPDGVRITIRDMVNSQYRLLTEVLGVRSLHAVMGISMGGMQTFEWMVAYPDFMKRAVPIVGSPRLASSDLLLWQAELSAIENTQQCACDLRGAMRAVQAMHTFALRTPAWQANNARPGDFEKLKSELEQSAEKGMSPLDWAAQLRAMMSHDVARNFGSSMLEAAKRVRAKTLVVVATQDHMVNPLPASEFARLAGASMLKLTGDCGHVATGCESARLFPAVRAFLEKR